MDQRLSDSYEVYVHAKSLSFLSWQDGVATTMLHGDKPRKMNAS